MGVGKGVMVDVVVGVLRIAVVGVAHMAIGVALIALMMVVAGVTPSQGLLAEDA